MPTKTAEKLRRRVIKSFMDILILAELKKSSLSGYDIIGLIHKRFGILMSSGTVYSLLYGKKRFDKGHLEQAKKSLHTNRKGKTKHKSHHQSKRGNPKFSKKHVIA